MTASTPPHERDDGWPVADYYKWIVATMGVPSRFYWNGHEWVAEAPFTKLDDAALARLGIEVAA